MEVIRNPVLQFGLQISRYYQGQHMCRYFMAINGEEISVVFQQVVATNSQDAPMRTQKSETAELETLISSFE